MPVPSVMSFLLVSWQDDMSRDLATQPLAPPCACPPVLRFTDLNIGIVVITSVRHGGREFHSAKIHELHGAPGVGGGGYASTI
jgi:hypothetical protein